MYPFRNEAGPAQINIDVFNKMIHATVPNSRLYAFIIAIVMARE